MAHILLNLLRQKHATSLRDDGFKIIACFFQLGRGGEPERKL